MSTFWRRILEHFNEFNALGRALGSHELLPQGADDVMKHAELDAAVITLGADGIYFKERKGSGGHVPAQARAVFDVTGAGDTVVAQLAIYLAAKKSLRDAVALANQAAGIVVGRLGTHAVTRKELVARLREVRPHGGKVVLRSDCVVVSFHRDESDEESS